MVQEILRGKALATVVESATVKDASGNVVELAGLRPDGTIGDADDVVGPDWVMEPVDDDEPADYVVEPADDQS
jgi:trigger factor